MNRVRLRRGSHSPPYSGWLRRLSMRHVAAVSFCRRLRASAVATLLLILANSAGCFSAEYESAPTAHPDGSLPYQQTFEEYLRATNGAADAPEDLAAPDSTCTPADSGLTSLRFSVRTTPVGGRFAPRNAGAIWVETADGQWVRTLERWGKRRAKWLEAFNMASGGDLTDAITRATLPQHEVHEVSWNLTDLAGCEVPDGTYQVRIEVTDWSGSGEDAAFAFEKGPEPVSQLPMDPEFFRDVQLLLE